MSDNVDDELLNATKNGDVAKVAQLLESGANPNAAEGTNGRSLELPTFNSVLHWAVKNGLMGIVKLLVNKGADVNAKNKDGESPLHWAAQNGFTDIVKILLENGADANSKDNTGTSVLSKASGGGKSGIASILLQYGAQAILSKDSKSSKGPFDFVKDQLFNSGGNNKGKSNILSDVIGGGVKDFFGRSSTSSAASSSHVQQQSYNRETRNVEELASAAEKRDVERVKQLLNEGASPDSHEPNNGDTCLHWAAWHQLFEIVEILLSRGATVDIRNRWGNTPLMWAAWAGADGMVQLLVERGAQINAFSEDGTTALMRALEDGHEGTGDLLIRLGADPTMRDGQGRTASDRRQSKK